MQRVQRYVRKAVSLHNRPEVRDLVHFEDVNFYLSRWAYLEAVLFVLLSTRTDSQRKVQLIGMIVQKAYTVQQADMPRV